MTNSQRWKYTSTVFNYPHPLALVRCGFTISLPFQFWHLHVQLIRGKDKNFFFYLFIVVNNKVKKNIILVDGLHDETEISAALKENGKLSNLVATSWHCLVKSPSFLTTFRKTGIISLKKFNYILRRQKWSNTLYPYKRVK